MISPEKTIYLTLKDLFDKTKIVIKDKKMKDCKLLLNDKYSGNPYFALVYMESASTPEYPNMKMQNETALMQLFANNNIDFKCEPQIIELFINNNIVDNVSMNNSWKFFLLGSFHNCPDLLQEYANEEVEKFNHKLNSKLKPKNEHIKKMKI